MSNYGFTQEEHSEWKKEKLKAIRDYHKDLIADLGIHFSDFNMKVIMTDGKGRQVIAVFASEFKKEKGLFFEIVNRGLEPATGERNVYRVPPSTSFNEEYELVKLKDYYLVPVEELRIVNPTSVAISKSSAVTSSDNVFVSKTIVGDQQKPSNEQLSPKQDAPYNDMTIRDYIAIHTGKPVSFKSWINELVSKPYNNTPF